MKLIVAMNYKGYIGRAGELMWKSSEDFKHFKKMTMGGILIVGSTTFEKDLKGRSLPGRTTLVVGGKYLTLGEAVRRAITEQQFHPYGGPDGRTKREIWVIGGSSIYEQLAPLCDEAHVSLINDNQIGDVTFKLPPDFRGKIITYNFEPNGKEN
jgi:dihydrofolate reductase